MAPGTFVYRGLSRKLVVAFDLGTTFSGVSYSILDPGDTPEVRGVTRFPGHEQVSGGSKIPTIVYYDRDGNVRAVGAEALQSDNIDKAKAEDWQKAEWFKLHIRPKLRGADSKEDESIAKIPPLPSDKSAVEIASDFFRYLFECTKAYIQESHGNGDAVWASVEKDIDFVVSHPNGWGGYQQSQLREALVMAGLVEEWEGKTNGDKRVSFITEGEAGLHFALRHGLPKATMEQGEGIIIVDGGGGTIDISAYRKPKFSDKFEEIVASECHFLGSVFVTMHARQHLDGSLKKSTYHEDLDYIVSCFDKTTKVWFSDDQKPQYIRFGSTRDTDTQHNIRFGQLKLTGETVAQFFQPSIECITECVKRICEDSPHSISHVVLVGGFSASEWLYKQLEQAVKMDKLKLEILRPQSHPNKAVSDGAVSSYLNSIVTARIARFSYGVMRNVEYNTDDPEHRRRIGDLLYRPSGRKLVPDAFEVMLAKGTKVSDETEVSIKMWKEVTDDTKRKLEKVPFTLYCYRGLKRSNKTSTGPKFMDEDSVHFSKLCSVQADLSKLPLEPIPKGNGVEGEFYRVRYSVVLLFNSAELKAHIRWEENGMEERTPASVIFFDDS
ncbi:hypothetical protein FA13DRAFT_1795529 [Coprinellus micaceus]|uniref:Actin-like ATPase domain-containing protein n=1 Tax=Coprinellus micaceus TaxID=71717 RepID=A0A4Y7SZF6_COPMI|nr:hypothetical protein FA13DRAFT_1795529 [Coprinellus micaceus]